MDEEDPAEDEQGVVDFVPDDQAPEEDEIGPQRERHPAATADTRIQVARSATISQECHVQFYFKCEYRLLVPILVAVRR